MDPIRTVLFGVPYLEANETCGVLTFKFDIETLKFCAQASIPLAYAEADARHGPMAVAFCVPVRLGF